MVTHFILYLQPIPMWRDKFLCFVKRKKKEEKGAQSLSTMIVDLDPAQGMDNITIKLHSLMKTTIV